ncbi:Uncharacterised protein [Bordetella pertussis]|nr:Uncharacterised protein [Bordetella pertussis]CFW32063.1 Uncharacterised protein [Bordetella pertussis]
MRPNSQPPTGRARKPPANTPSVASSAEVGSAGSNRFIAR